ncbi:MAG: hypothetical protein NVSMB14_09050 [Isosphaeraceae bacterium]
MTSLLVERVERWAEIVGVDRNCLPASEVLRAGFPNDKGQPWRAPADPRLIAAWERRHGFDLPRGLKAWLEISDGFYRSVPLIHPLHAIGPMIPFAQVPNLIVQPESWFELGNPDGETICVDLAYDWPGGDRPIFASGDDRRGLSPRIVSSGFNDWFLRLLHQGGREFWVEPGFQAFGDPWIEHKRRAPAPPLPERLQPLAASVRPLMRPDADDRRIALLLGISRGDVETIFRHLQHQPVDIVNAIKNNGHVIANDAWNA